MIKFIVAALWIVAAAIGAVFYSFQTTQTSVQATEAPEFFGGLDYVKTEVITVPVLKNGRVDGYFLARLVYTAEPEKLKALSLPAESLLIDEVYSYLFSNPLIDFSAVKTLDVDALRNGVAESINKRVGEKLVHEVLVEQVDYLSKEDIRDNQSRRRDPRG